MAPVNKLNFWQWLGIAIIVVGLLVYLWRTIAADEEAAPEVDDSTPSQVDTTPTTPTTPGTPPAPADGQAGT